MITDEVFQGNDSYSELTEAWNSFFIYPLNTSSFSSTQDQVLDYIPSPALITM